MLRRILGSTVLQAPVLSKNSVRADRTNVYYFAPGRSNVHFRPTIKEEKVTLAEYEDLADAYQRISEFLNEVYTRKPIHSSLGYLTPAEFESQWQVPKATQPFFDCHCTQTRAHYNSYCS